MDLRKVRPRHLVEGAFWRRAGYSMVDLLRPTVEVVPGSDIELLDFPNCSAAPRPRRLRILFAASRYDYGDRRRGLGIEENYFLHALVAMGHQVVRFDSLRLAKRLGRSRMNRLLFETADRYQPDVLFTVMFKEEFDPAIVSSITKWMAGRTVAWFSDDQWRFETYSRRWAPNFGWAVTTSRAAEVRYQAAGITNVLRSQWGCNHFLYRPVMADEWKVDVSFVGQPHGSRPAVIDQLRRANIPVSVWGFGWPAGRITLAEMIRVFSSSRINLNLSNASVNRVDQVKGRDFEVPGCRGFLLTKESEELADSFELGREVETYTSVDSLIDKIRHYLGAEAEREAVAHAGYRRTLADHTMESRLTRIFERVVHA